MNNKDAWMGTYTGRRFYFYDPKPEDICIEDIAHSLSMQCRFLGHCKYFYSVAQHSIIVSRYVLSNLTLYGLLHDASEAYISDIIRPFKSTLEGYKIVENRIQNVIYRKYGLEPGFGSGNIKKIDTMLLKDEAEFFMVNSDSWQLPSEGLGIDFNVECIPYMQIESNFLDLFYKLYNGPL